MATPRASEGDVGDEGVDIDGEVLNGDAPILAPDDSLPALDIEGISLEEVSAAALLQATANLNLRKGPSTGHAVLKVIPKGATVARVAGPSKGWYQVRSNGTTGWSSGTYLKVVGGGGGDVNGPPSPANAVARAAKSVGFSYWWGLGDGRQGMRVDEGGRRPRLQHQRRGPCRALREG